MGPLRGPRDEAAQVRHRARAELARIRRRTQDETVRASLSCPDAVRGRSHRWWRKLSLVVDRWISPREASSLPALLSATVDSARTVLSTVASATITFSGIAFAVSLLMIQLVSSQFSPRAVYGFYRDTFNKVVMGVAVGTFTYCLLVLRAIRRPFEEGGQAVIPYVSVFLGLAMGMVTILAVLAFINHSAHSMEATEIIRRIAEDTRAQIAKMRPLPGTPDPSGEQVGLVPEEPGFVIRADREGGSNMSTPGALLSSVPERGFVRLDTGAGMFPESKAPRCARCGPSPRTRSLPPLPRAPRYGWDVPGRWSRTWRWGSSSSRTSRCERCPRASTTRPPHGRRSCTSGRRFATCCRGTCHR